MGGSITLQNIGAIRIGGTLGSLTVGTDGVGNLTIEDRGIIDIDGRLGSLTVEGDTTLDSDEGVNITFYNSGKLWFKGDFDSSAGSDPAIVADDGTSALDIIDELEFNGLVTGYDDGGDNSDPDITASQIGNVTFAVALDHNDEIMVTDFGIRVRPNSAGDENQDVADTEQVNIDGSNLSDYSIGNITVESTLSLPWTGTNLFGGKNSFVALGAIGNVSLIGGVSGGQQSGLFETEGDSAWFVVGDTDGLNNQTWNLPDATLGTNTDTVLTEDTDAAESATATDYTGGTVSIGDVTVNARQSDKATDVSGVDNINGWEADIFGGLGILSGVRASNAVGASGSIIRLWAPGNSLTNVVEIDADLAGNIGDILIRSDNSVAFRDDATIGVGAGGGNITGTGILQDDAAGIVASGQTGLIQLDPGLSSNGDAAILGDGDATEDNAVGSLQAGVGAGVNEIVVVIV